jgi:hypothetical protein
MVVENIKNIMGEEFTYIFIANDYGAGVHLFEISKLVNSNKYFVFLGPSRSLLNDCALNYEDLGILDNLPNNLNYKIFIGSGWQTHLEFNAVQKCNQKNLDYYVIIDNWVNYKERFIRQNKIVNPKKIIVFDSLAKQLALSNFENSKIYQLDNLYCEQLKSEFHQSIEDSIIVFLDPIINQPNLISDRVIFLLEKIMSEEKISKLKIRLHPSESISPNEIVSRFEDYFSEIEICTAKKSLIEDLSNCKVAVGIQSYALYISALLGIKTYSIGKYLGIEVTLPSAIEVI